MQQVLASVWRPVMGMYAVTLVDDLFLFQFPHSKDLQRVIEDGPWSFDNQLLVCDQVPVGTRPEDVALDSIPFWVQVHGLPAMYASPDFVAKIGDYVGSFIAADPFNFGGAWRSFYRIRVRMSVSAPLKRRMKLLHRDGGILPDAFPFGAWMRAGPRRQVKPVGARWLLSPTSQSSAGPITPDAGPPPATLVAMEESGRLHGDLKRRREEVVRMDGLHEEDVQMAESPKNLEKASLVDQARPVQ
ncbi:PREDICTED: uncharacterized protein LOC109192810 [Ipomoea nil]|uniref:uncharacterized protein LOC109192810 n=1 Tax=Ipomoea nil TaxID=35883 RepID=UPI00090118FA|nr:PREDICTED: uncharacterized protein LOC109192810 [Ipomoea nil]